MKCVSSFQHVLPNAYYVLINVYVPVCIAELDTMKVTDSITTYSSIMEIKEKHIFILMTYLKLFLSKKWTTGHLLYLVSILHMETFLLGPIRWTSYVLTCFSNAKHTLIREWEWWGPWPVQGWGLRPRLHLKYTKGRNYGGKEWRLTISAFKGFDLKKYQTLFMKGDWAWVGNCRSFHGYVEVCHTICSNCMSHLKFSTVTF